MSIQRLTRSVGIDPKVARDAARGLRTFRRNLRDFRAQAAASGREFELGGLYPCLSDRYQSSGVAKGYYFHQDLHVARLVHRNEPERHIDVGSRVDGFVAHVAAFRPIEVIDLRPLEDTVENISFVQRDVMIADARWNESTDSLSCLHALEHFGLGRYGDSIDYYGYLKGWAGLSRMIRSGGTFYFSVPISSRQRIEFDAHRVFSLPYLLRVLIEPSFTIESFAYVDDRGDLSTDADVHSSAAQRTFDLHYGCGIFELIKRD